MKSFVLFILNCILFSIVYADNGHHIESIPHSDSAKQIRPQDDFYLYTNADWLKNTVIPNDKASWGTFQHLAEHTSDQLHSIIIKILQTKNLAVNSNEQKIAFLYTSYMNESYLNSLGVSPLKPLLDMVDSVPNKSQLPQLIANLNMLGVVTPYGLLIHQDARNASVVVADLVQSGLGLPDRDYYIKPHDKNLLEIKNKYQSYIESMLQMEGDKYAASSAKQIVDIETKLAQIQWDNVTNRDPIKTYNKLSVKQLRKLMPGYNWDLYLRSSAIKGRINYVIVSQPSYLQNLNSIINDNSLANWKLYFRWHILNGYASYLSKGYHDTRFGFYGTTLRGIPSDTPRWKEGLNVVNDNLCFALGRLYVDQYFTDSSKIKIKQIVNNLIKEYNISINSLDWMTPRTKIEARKKLATMLLKIGYPDKWQDYTKLSIKEDDLVGNLFSSNKFEYYRNINKLGKPLDTGEWEMSPQTVNAYYNPEINEIVFPAAILQSPFFDVVADNATNYGGIGAVIGHEISHAFDDQGSQYDANGNLRNWWTKQDKINFRGKTRKLIKQYGSYSPFTGYYVNGKLTLGENIADNAGLSIAYKAYYLSLANQTAPIIDGLSADQRLYTNWAQIWRTKIRQKQALVYLKTDPHAPAQFRTNGSLSNQNAFYKAYHVESTDKMYIKMQDRVSIW